MIIELIGPAAAGYAAIAIMIGSFITSPGLAFVRSAFAEGANTPESIDKIQIKAIVPGVVLTTLLSLGVMFVAPWILRVFGPDYALEADDLLKWIALSAPLIVITRLYFTRLLINKKIGLLVLLSSIQPVVILGISAWLIPSRGLVAVGISWFLAYFIISMIIMWRGIQLHVDTRRR